MIPVIGLVSQAKSLGAVDASLKDAAVAERWAGEAREQGMEVISSHFGAALGDVDAVRFYEQKLAEHRSGKAAELALASVPQVVPTPAQSAMPTPAELHALAGGDKIAASIYRHGGAVITDPTAWQMRQQIEKARQLANVGVGYQVHEVRLPERDRPLPPPIPTCPTCCAPKASEDAVCACERDPSWARPPR